MTRFGFSIRTKAGQRVDNIQILATTLADAERRLRQMYVNCEIVEHREQSVPHELQDLPAMLEDGGDLTIEIVVEHSDDRLRRQPVRQVGVAAHVGEPDRGADFVGVATPDLARENTRAGVVAHIGVENIARGRYPLRPSSKNSKRHLRGERRVGLR